jgi:HSP20 family protein
VSFEKEPNKGSERPEYDIMRIIDSYIEKSFKGFDSFYDENSFPVELQETQTDIIIEAKLPKYSKDQISIEVEGNNVHITVSDHKIIEEQDDTRKYYRKEQSYSKIGRTVTLPFPISKKGTTAEFQDGVLTIITQNNGG